MSKNKFIGIEKFNEWFKEVEQLSTSKLRIQEHYQPRWIKYWQDELTPEEAIKKEKIH